MPGCNTWFQNKVKEVQKEIWQKEGLAASAFVTCKRDDVDFKQLEQR